MNVTLKDFQPLNRWSTNELIGENQKDGFVLYGHVHEWSDGTPQYIYDESTKRRYLNQSKMVIRIKCLLLALATPIAHLALLICNIVYRVLKLTTFSHFWMPSNQSEYQLNNRLKEAGADVIRIVAAPFALVGLELSTLFGLVRPYDGRKLYATIERAMYNRPMIAPCFQPDAEYHLMGGKIDNKWAF